MKMYSSYREACYIFESISPEFIYNIREEISGDVITGTKMELLHKIHEADQAANGEVSHVPYCYYYHGEEPSDEYVEAWAIIECAYAF